MTHNRNAMTNCLKDKRPVASSVTQTPTPPSDHKESWHTLNNGIESRKLQQTNEALTLKNHQTVWIGR